MNKTIISLALSALISAPVVADSVYFANDETTTTDVVPDLHDVTDPVIFIGRASTPASKAYNYNLGLKRAWWVANTSEAPNIVVRSIGESYPSGNQPTDRRVDILFPVGKCNSVNGHFPCTSRYSWSFLRDLPQEARVGVWQD